MPRRYVQIPTQQPDDELEAVFDASDEESDDAVVQRPLLSAEQRPLRESDDDERVDQPQQTPRTSQHPTIDGRYNFEYDYPPPPGSPPLERAEPSNTWGNSNGVIPDFSHPRTLPRHATGWLSKTWRALTGTGQKRPEQRVVGSGIQNDGVFGNISARPVPARAARAQSESAREQDSILHAPEFASSDAPPSYNVAQLDQPPSYWDNTVLATATEDFLIDNLPAGSIFAFLWSFLLSFSLQWIGFAIAWMLSTSHAGRFGARAGLGVALVQLGLSFRQRVDDMNNGEVPYPLPEDESVTNAFPAPTGGVANSTVPEYPESASFTYQTIALNEWVAMILMTAGWFLFMTSLLGYWRVKRWETSIRASQPRPAPQPPQPSPEERVLFTQLHERNLGWHFIVSQGLGLRRGMGMFAPHGRLSEEDIPTDVDDLTERGENERRRAPEVELDPEEQAFRRNLRSIGLI